jgi:N,N'-diacetyllegionaminate synthase
MLVLDVGYSDHTLGIEIPLAAFALGATVIEKHFTLAKTIEGPYHDASLDPQELQQIINAIRNIEKEFSSDMKQASVSVIKNKAIARKSIHLLKNLKARHILNESDFIMKKPKDGIFLMQMENIIGKVGSSCKIKMRIEDLQ